MVLSDRSHPLTGCQRYCGRRRLLSSPSTSAMSVRERLVHPRFTGLAAREARLATPYGQDWHGLHYASAPLRPHQTCGKEVRLRLDFFDARFILSGSVVQFAPDTSSEGERKRKTVTDGVPLHCTPSLPDSLSGIATLSLRSICAGPRCSRGFSSYVAAAGFPQGLPSQYCLVSLNRSNPSASTPSLKPLPPARLARPKCVAVPHCFDHPCQSRKDRHLSPDRRTVRLLPRLSACLLTLRKTERTMLSHRPFRLPSSRAVGYTHAPSPVHNGTKSHA